MIIIIFFLAKNKPLNIAPLYSLKQYAIAAKLTGQKVDAGISCIFNHFKIDVSGFYSVLSIFKIRKFYSQSSPQMLPHLAWDSSISQFT